MDINCLIPLMRHTDYCCSDQLCSIQAQSLLFGVLVSRVNDLMPIYLMKWLKICLKRHVWYDVNLQLKPTDKTLACSFSDWLLNSTSSLLFAALVSKVNDLMYWCSYLTGWHLFYHVWYDMGYLFATHSTDKTLDHTLSDWLCSIQAHYSIYITECRLLLTFMLHILITIIGLDQLLLRMSIKVPAQLIECAG